MCIDFAPFCECPTSVGCSKEVGGSWQGMGRQCMHFTRRQGHGADLAASRREHAPPPTHRLHAIAGNAVWRSYIPTHVNYTTLMGKWRARGMLNLATPQTPLPKAARSLQTLPQTLQRCCHCRQQHLGWHPGHASVPTGTAQGRTSARQGWPPGPPTVAGGRRSQ